MYKKVLSLLLVSIMLFGILFTNNNSYAAEVYHYRAYVDMLRDKFGEYETPTPLFDVYINNRMVGSSPLTHENTPTTEVVESLEVKNLGEIHVGDTLKIVNQSILGEGNRFIGYDLQLGEAYKGYSGFRRFRSIEFNSSIELEYEGDYVVYLNIADNYNLQGWGENWSNKGNWKTNITKEMGNNGVQVKGWYFVALRFTVLPAKGDPEPEPPVDPEEPPEPPRVEEGYAYIEIVERDDDPNTPSNEIYEGESIQFRGDAYSPIGSVAYGVDGGGIRESGESVINNTFISSYPDDKGEAYQLSHFTNYRFDPIKNTYVPFRDYIEDSVKFKVKEIKPPVIEVSGDIRNDNLSIIHLGKPTQVKTIVYDINKPSEEHPDGFDIVEESWQFIKNSTGQVVLRGPGLLNEDDFVFQKGIFETEEYYILRSTAYNAFKPIRRTEHDVEIFIENLPPVVEPSIVSEDGEPPTFAKETFDLKVDAKDEDGYVDSVSVEVLENIPELSFLGRTVIKPLWQEHFLADYKYISDIACIPTFRITATDEKGAETILDIKENIVRPTVIADIKVDNEHEIQKKVYRYISLDFSDSYENAPFGIDFSKTKIKYKYNDEEWKDISKEQNIDDENVRIYYPNYPEKDKLEMYQKKEGEIKFSVQVFDKKDFDSKEAIKSLTIGKDEAPVVNYDIESMQHRITENDVKENADRSKAIKEENIGKGYIKIIDKSKSIDGDKLREKIFYVIYDAQNNGIDNDVEYTTIIAEDINGHAPETEIILNAEQNNLVKVKDLNNVIITFLTQKDGLGNYYIKEKVKEEITQLPQSSSPLYQEILEHELESISNYSNVFIDNLLPTITFEIGIDREINIIVHYDDYIAPEMQEKINDLVRNLESRGLKVRLIKYENKY